jgi:hypothetical protein
MNTPIERIEKSARENMRLYKQRRGQALMNALFFIEPKAYRAIDQTMADPFYRSEREPAFWEAVQKFFEKNA